MVTQGDVRQTSKKKKSTYHTKKLYNDVLKKHEKKDILCETNETRPFSKSFDPE